MVGTSKPRADPPVSFLALQFPPRGHGYPEASEFLDEGPNDALAYFLPKLDGHSLEESPNGLTVLIHR